MLGEEEVSSKKKSLSSASMRELEPLAQWIALDHKAIHAGNQGNATSEKKKRRPRDSVACRELTRLVRKTLGTHPFRHWFRGADTRDRRLEKIAEERGCQNTLKEAPYRQRLPSRKLAGGVTTEKKKGGEAPRTSFS